MKIQLKLQYQEHSQHTTSAVFIRGEQAFNWLRTINEWDIDLEKFHGYVIPQSIRSTEPAGLFVILKTGSFSTGVVLQNPYTQITNKLFIPVNASLFPEMDTKELQSLLLYDCQVFHPSIGLIGFQKSDRLDWKKLFRLSSEKENDWTFAKDGYPKPASLQSIGIITPKMADFFESMKEDVGSKPLDDIPGNKEEKESDAMDKFFSSIYENMLKKGLSLSDAIKESLNNKEGKTSSSSGSGGGLGGGLLGGLLGGMGAAASPGMFGKLESWARNKLDELERKRKSELDRLSDLFDTDPDEALKYAIPLDSPYQNRGIAPPSGRLGPRSTNFNMGKLGGGRNVDGWNVDSHYFELQHKYRKAATKAIQDKAYKKAAYIYAHLLGDYNAAANVLKQGEYYRDAAILYKEHLKNLVSAAECFEKGGFLSEGIELYIELKKHEKVGDLYTELGQYENAQSYYQTSIDLALGRNNYIDAARITEKKLKDLEAAKKHLLTGWKKNKQHSNCLQKYFHLIAEEDQEKLTTEVIHLFNEHTPIDKQSVFLHVLIETNKSYKNPELKTASKEITYKVISEQVSNQNNLNNLFLLKDFLQDDRLISSDCSRFQVQQKSDSNNRIKKRFQLNKSIKWIDAIVHQDQFLLIGIAYSRLHLARGNWYGDITYYSWDQEVREDDVFQLINNPYNSNVVVLYSARSIPFHRKTLFQDKYFRRKFEIIPSSLLPSNLIGISLLQNDSIAVLHAQNKKSVMDFYDTNGVLSSSKGFKANNDMLSAAIRPDRKLSPLFHKDKAYFTIINGRFVKMDEQGEIFMPLVKSGVQLMAMSTHPVKAKIVINTELDFSVLSTHDLTKIQSFGQSIKDPIKIVFISNNHFIIVTTYEVFIYLVDPNHIILKRKMDTRVETINALPTRTRNQFALLDVNYALTIYDA